jgi:hypothetical protein
MEPTHTLLQQFLDALLTPSGIATAASLVAAALGLVLGNNAVRRRRLALAAYHAFHVVEDLSLETTSTADDKVAAGLKALDAYLLAQGWRAAKPGEQEVARLTFTALSGEAKLETKIRADAATTAAEAQAVIEARPTPPLAAPPTGDGPGARP